METEVIQTLLHLKPSLKITRRNIMLVIRKFSLHWRRKIKFMAIIHIKKRPNLKSNNLIPSMVAIQWCNNRYPTPTTQLLMSNLTTTNQFKLNKSMEEIMVCHNSRTIIIIMWCKHKCKFKNRDHKAIIVVKSDII